MFHAFSSSSLWLFPHRQCFAMFVWRGVCSQNTHIFGMSHMRLSFVRREKMNTKAMRFVARKVSKICTLVAMLMTVYPRRCEDFL